MSSNHLALVPVRMPRRQCPPGLEALIRLDQIRVYQHSIVPEMVFTKQPRNKYSIKNNYGQLMYFVVENNENCTRMLCTFMRPFELFVYVSDYLGIIQEEPVLILHRPFRCSAFCWPCCLQVLEVITPAGNIIGLIEQEWTLLRPRFRVKNAAGDVVMKIEGGWFGISCDQEIFYTVLSPNSIPVGSIVKHWPGCCNRWVCSSDYFTISFPIDMEVQMKALLVGACFLINFMYFEHTDIKEADRLMNEKKRNLFI